MNITFRYAQATDTGLILQLIKELAEYEKMLHEVVATEEMLKEKLFEKQQAEVLFFDGGRGGSWLCFILP